VTGEVHFEAPLIGMLRRFYSLLLIEAAMMCPDTPGWRVPAAILSGLIGLSQVAGVRPENL
jgi:hypothetical protein